MYENLDLMVHPMRVHFNDALLANLWVRINLYGQSLDLENTLLWSHDRLSHVVSA